MKNICIIPARGGSKRIPRKNIKDFLGKPILAYAIENAQNCGIFDEIIVSTDDLEIVEIAIKYGAKVPFLRTKKTANDFSSTADVLLEVLSNYDESFDYVCCLYPCTPLLEAKNLMSAFDKLKLQKLDTVFPVIEFSVPIQRAMLIKNDIVYWKHPENALVRTQDLEKTYHDAGQFYFMNTKAFLDSKKILTSNSGAIVLSEIDVQDVDNEIDWKMAELKYKLKNEEI